LAMNKIDTYRFGLIEVGGKKYISDVIISPDGVRSNWERKKGHQLCLGDIADIINENPEVLVVGTGAFGLVKVPPEVQEEINDRGIELIVESTEKACRTYNKLCHSRRVIAAFHLTC